MAFLEPDEEAQLRAKAFADKYALPAEAVAELSEMVSVAQSAYLHIEHLLAHTRTGDVAAARTHFLNWQVLIFSA